MSQTAILGAGVMGETLLSGLVRAGPEVRELQALVRRRGDAREPAARE